MQEIYFEIIEFEQNTYHPLVKAELEGVDSYWWVIDTGASKSVFNSNLARYYTLDHEDSISATGLGKELVETNSAMISSISLGGIDFGPLQVALVDFLHINEEYAKFSDKKIAGLIGSDFLVAHNAIIDFGAKKITLMTE
jgi:Aspartyl protease